MPSPSPSPSPSPQSLLTTHGAPPASPVAHDRDARGRRLRLHHGLLVLRPPVPTGSLILDELPVLHLGPRCVIGCSKLSCCIQFHLPVSLPPWLRDVAPRSCPAPRLKVHVRAVACVGTAGFNAVPIDMGLARRPSPPTSQRSEIRNQYPPAFHHGVHHDPHHTRRKTCPCPGQYRRLLYRPFLKHISHRRALDVPRTKHPAGLPPAARLVSLDNAGTWVQVGFFHSHTRMPMPMQAASQTNRLLTNQQINSSISVPHYMLHLPTCPLHTTLHQSGNHRLTVAHLLFAKLLLVPPLTLQCPREHRRHLVDQEYARRVAVPPTNHPPARPLNPFAQVVRMQHVLEQSVLGNHVHLVHALNRLALFGCLAPLLTVRSPSDLAQVVVVEIVAQQSPAPYHEPQEAPSRPSCPVVYRRWSVARKPASNHCRVDQLKDRYRKAYHRAHGRHARVEEHWCNDRAVRVMNELYTWSEPSSGGLHQHLHSTQP
jgi:hypothetical protein